jgi:glycosyltransferase involved in cell wall biosynthesis
MRIPSRWGQRLSDVDRIGVLIRLKRNDSNMRILLALHHVLRPDGGAEGVTLALGSSLGALGCDVEYFGFKEAFGAGATQTSWSTARYPWRIARFLRKRASDFDVFDISSGDNWVWAMRGRPRAKPIHALITRSHGLEHTCNAQHLAGVAARGQKPGWKFRVYWAGYREWEVRQSLLRADMSILCNEMDRDFAAEKLSVPLSKMTVMPNGIAPYFLETPVPPDSADKRLRLAFVGSWIERKGIDAVIKAAAQLVQRRLDFRLTIYGSRVGEEAVLQSFDPAVRERVSVVPAYRHDELPRLLADEEILLFPSRSEGFSVALTECMACGLAPIATPVGGASILIAPDANGILIPVDDLAAVVRAIESLASNRGALLEMRRRARATGLEYGWDVIAKRTLELYDSVLVARAATR